MLTDAETSIGYLAEEVRVKVVKGPPGAETYLKLIGEALRYLKDDFESAEKAYVGWQQANKALHDAHADVKRTRYATDALFVHLRGEGRIVEVDPAVTGQFVQRA